MIKSKEDVAKALKHSRVSSYDSLNSRFPECWKTHRCYFVLLSRDGIQLGEHIVWFKVVILPGLYYVTTERREIFLI